MNGQPCPLCSGVGGELLVRTDAWRIVLADEPGIPGFVRVIRNAHAAEMSALSAAERSALMDVVWAVEDAVLRTLQPDKINLASLGNVVPHLHWHVVPRWRDDPWFPQPIWAPPQRAVDAAVVATRQARVASLRAVLAGALSPAGARLPPA